MSTANLYREEILDHYQNPHNFGKLEDFEYKVTPGVTEGATDYYRATVHGNNIMMRIKFMTINIWDGGRLFNSLVTLLKKEDPDIVAMQEVYNGKQLSWEKRYRALTELKKALGYEYNAFAPAFLDTRTIGDIKTGNVVFSKFPILKQNVTFYDVGYGRFRDENVTDWQAFPYNLQHCLVMVDQQKLNVFNTHGIGGIDGKDNQRRLNMSKVIVFKIKDQKKVVLAGDFNVRPNTKTIQNIERHLTNVFKDEMTTTFNMRWKDKPGYRDAVVDMIFVSEDLKVIDHYCPQVDISDHLPLVCTFEL